ncbi:MAG: hypothetical protein ABEJ95_01085 [Candidatus Nanohalobium sp.]
MEEILEEFQDAVSLVNESTQMLSELMDEIMETEKEENQVEQLTAQLTQEFEFMEREVAELEKDYAQLQDQKHEQMAQKEGQELKQEEKHEKQEDQEEQKIDAEIQNEVKTSEQLIKEDEQLLKLVDQSIDDLRSLYQLLQSEKSIWNFALNTNPPLGDIEETINMMQDAMNSDKDALEGIESEESKARNMIPSRTAARAGITASKLILLVVGVVVAASLYFVYAP